MPVLVRRTLRGRALGYDALFPALEVPVLATHGDRDTVLLPELSRRLAARVRHGRYSCYEGVGHAPFLQAPARFNRELLEFALACTAPGDGVDADPAGRAGSPAV